MDLQKMWKVESLFFKQILTLLKMLLMIACSLHSCKNENEIVHFTPDQMWS